MNRTNAIRVHCWVVAVLAIGSSASGVELSLVPVRASGPHTLIDENGIHLSSGGQRIWFEIQTWQWDLDGDGVPLVGVIQGAINLGSYGPPGGGPQLSLAHQPCVTHSDCTVSMGQGSQCRTAVSGCPPGEKCCESAFVDLTRPDHPCFGSDNCVAGADNTDLRFGFSKQAGVVDNHTKRYMGTLVLDVPPGLVGAVTPTFRTPESYYSTMQVPSGMESWFDILPADTKPARVFVAVNPVSEYVMKGRYLAYPLPRVSSTPVSHHVTLLGLYRPIRYPVGSPYPPPDYSSLENQNRWLGPPVLH